MGRPSKPHLASNGYYRCRIGGKAYHLGKSKAVAHRRFHELMAQHGLAEQPPETVAQLVERWLNLHEGRDSYVRDWGVFAGNRRVFDLPGDILDQFAEWLRAQTYLPPGHPAKPRRKYAPSTVYSRVLVAAETLRPAVRAGLIRDPRRPRLPRSTRTAKDLPAERIAAILASLKGPPALIMRFIASTGCRPGEAAALTWAEVDLTTRTAVLAKHKTAIRTGKARTIFLTAPAVALLESLPHRDGLVFRNRLGKKFTRQGLTYIGSRHGFTPYQLRHSFAQIASEELPEQDLARLMGHAHQQTTRWYYEVRDARARAAAERLGARLAFLHTPEPRKKAAGDVDASPAPARKPRRTRWIL